MTKNNLMEKKTFKRDNMISYILCHDSLLKVGKNRKRKIEDRICTTNFEGHENETLLKMLPKGSKF